MTEVWVEPKSWQAGEALTPAKLNAYISAQNSYLRYRNPVTGTDTTGVVITSLTPVAVSNTNLRFILDVQENEDIVLSFKLWAMANAVTVSCWWDWYIDDSYYLSSGTDTPLIRGVAYMTPTEVSQMMLISHRRIVQGLTKGGHSFVLTAARSASTLTHGKVTIQGRGL